MDVAASLTRSLPSAALASLATTAAVALLGKQDAGSPYSGVNAISHILWGERATIKDEFSPEYTLTGAALNSAAALGWAWVHELAFEGIQSPRKFLPAIATGSLVSAAAYVIDYFVVPKRLTPGFEHRLKPRSMFVVYAALAASLALGALVGSARR